MKEINKNKKLYKSPLIEEVKVDNEVSMMDPTGDGGPEDPWAPAASPSPSKAVSPVQANAPSTENDPFGGTTITY